MQQGKHVNIGINTWEFQYDLTGIMNGDISISSYF